MESEPERVMTPEEARRDHWQMLRYMSVNALLGVAIGALTAGVLIWLNIGAVGTHIARSTSPVLATLMVVVPFVAVGNLFANRGPLFFAQERVGKQGRSFRILKFRTMTVEPWGERMDGAGKWTAADDVRITPFGRFLRKSHLDELPQALNILRGDLSVVGDRHHRIHLMADLLGRDQDALAHFRQHRAAGGAVEQPLAKPRLQCRDAPGDRGLGQIEPLGGGTEAAGLDNAGENHQVERIEGRLHVIVLFSEQ